ncbi:MAG: Xaa-Pro peptidase family protein [Anaeromyxobacter sp.]
MILDDLSPALALSGLAVGVLLPRGGRAALLLASALLALLVAALRAGVAGALVWHAAAQAGLAVGLAALLVGALPRLALFLGLWPALFALLGVSPLEHRWLAAGAALLALIAAVVLARPARIGWHALGACVGALLLGAGVPALDGWLLRLGAAGLLLFVSLRLWRPVGLEPLRARAALGLGAAAGLAAAGLVVALPRLLPALPAPAEEPWAGRRAQLAAAAPGGGLVWPAPEDVLLGLSGDRGAGAGGYEARWLTGRTSLWPQVLPGDGSGLRLSLHAPLTRLRAIKSPAELASLRLAARATVGGVRAVLPLLRAGATPTQVSAALEGAWRAEGCPGLAFNPLVLSGRAAASPHGLGQPGPLGDGELLVLDVGCRTPDGYTSDFTRTFPVGGRFTAEQRRLYQAVLDAQQLAIAGCRPGVRLGGRQGDSLYAEASAELLRRTGQALVHGLGHGVGLSVHDPLPDGPLEPGMVITIEPGFYDGEQLGIRIEDTLLVTATGCEPLTAGLPADPDTVEAALAGGAVTR